MISEGGVEAVVIAQDAAQAILPWVERLGGWGVVLVVVRWQMTRIDRTMDLLDESVRMFKSSSETFKAFEHDEDVIHDSILRTQAEILAEIRALRAK